MSRDDAHLLDILRCARRAIEGLGDAAYDQLQADWKLQNIVLHELLILGEAAKRLSDGFRSQHTDVAWDEIAGLRDIIVHQYDRIKLEIIWKRSRMTSQNLSA